MKGVALLAALLFVPLTAAAEADQPTQFKGIVLGAPADMGALTTEWHLKCAGNLCVGPTTIAGVDGYVGIKISEEGLTTSILVTIKAGAYETVVDALREKYGPPSSGDSNMATNAMGARAAQQTLIWKRKDGAMVVAALRLTKFTEATISYIAKGELEKSRKERAEKARSDL